MIESKCKRLFSHETTDSFLVNMLLIKYPNVFIELVISESSDVLLSGNIYLESKFYIDNEVKYKFHNLNS